MNPLTSELSQSDTKKLTSLLQTLIGSAGFQLQFHIQQDPASEVAGDAPADASGGRLRVEFTGPDTPMLTARNGELLNALEYIAAKVIRLEQESHDRISFDADSFKANRDLDLRHAADEAVASVRRTGRPYAFAPMTSHERRLLHLVLSESGMPTASSGDVPRRYVVLYPENHRAAASTPSPGVSDALPGEKRAIAGGRDTPNTEDRVQAIRSSFRRR